MDWVTILFQAGNECHCGNEIRHSFNTVGGCDRKCSGNSSQTCGGGWRVQIYSSKSLNTDYEHDQ